MAAPTNGNSCQGLPKRKLYCFTWFLRNNITIYYARVQIMTCLCKRIQNNTQKCPQIAQNTVNRRLGGVSEEIGSMRMRPPSSRMLVRLNNGIRRNMFFSCTKNTSSAQTNHYLKQHFREAASRIENGYVMRTIWRVVYALYTDKYAMSTKSEKRNNITEYISWIIFALDS